MAIIIHFKEEFTFFKYLTDHNLILQISQFYQT